jgi:MoxR-like ATPase
MLLNSIAEALGLEHRHYNASLVSFDDLIGFPYPDDEKTSVRFLETPATIWGAQSVLIDEISRCKPEHQNRLFSLIQERRAQGIALENLRFRWAAMNPCAIDSAGEYMGSEPLDRALADRFALIVRVPDWRELSPANKRKVANPSIGRSTTGDGKRLAGSLDRWRCEFLEMLRRCPKPIVDYSCAAAASLGTANVRLSPRRVKMLSRSLLAAMVVSGGKLDSSLFRLILECSIPNVASGDELAKSTIAAAHTVAWDMISASKDRKWIHEFLIEPKLSKKAGMLLKCPNADIGSVAVAQLLESDSPERTAVFSMALYPAAAAGYFPAVKAEAVVDLGKMAHKVLSVDSSTNWSDPYSEDTHPQMARSLEIMKTVSGSRAERASQLLAHLMTTSSEPAGYASAEEELDECVRSVAEQIPEVNPKRTPPPRPQNAPYWDRHARRKHWIHHYSQRIASTLLGDGNGSIRCPRIRTLGLDFGPEYVHRPNGLYYRDPVEIVYAALERCGYSSVEELRSDYDLPLGPKMAVASTRYAKTNIESLSDSELLEEALLLGLCTNYVYDPSRPVVWTIASLSRFLDIYELGSFYALD